MSVLEVILKEVNPLRDMENVEFYPLTYDKDIMSKEERFSSHKKNLPWFKDSYKPFIRGAVVGGTLGTIIGVATGSAQEGLEMGTMLGVFLDSAVYAIRLVYIYREAQD